MPQDRARRKAEYLCVHYNIKSFRCDGSSRSFFEIALLESS
jgi:hypothetical protein